MLEQLPHNYQKERENYVYIYRYTRRVYFA